MHSNTDMRMLYKHIAEYISNRGLLIKKHTEYLIPTRLDISLVNHDSCELAVE